MIDVHCHILPALDDGPPSVEKSVEMCRIAVDDGIHTIVATPHMLNGMFDVSCAAVRQGVQALTEVLGKEGIPLRLLPGADVHVDKDLPRHLAERKVLTLADMGKHLMVELPQDVLPMELAHLLFQIQLKGVTPIITHPERNIEIQRTPSLLNEFIHKGSLTQVTAGSLTGIFGSRAQECALKLLRRNMLHLVATDGHNAGKRAPRLSAARKVVEQEAGGEEAKTIFDERPARLLEGAYVEPPDPVRERSRPEKKSFWRRLLST